MKISKIHKGLPIRTHRVEVFEQVCDEKYDTIGIVRLTVNQIMFATLLTQVLTFGFTKLSVLLFYRRLVTHLLDEPSTHTAPEYFKDPYSEPPCGR